MAKVGKKYAEALKLIEADKLYEPVEAIELVKKTATAKFDETVEISFNNSDANECIFLPTRQQIVVYPEARSMLKHIAWVHP